MLMEEQFSTRTENGKIILKIDNVEHTLTVKTALALRGQLYNAIGNARNNIIIEQLYK